MNWDDLRFFLELARLRRLNRVGRKLGVDHTTVARRVAQLEAALDCRLFETTPVGYELTAAGTRLLAQAESVETGISLLGEAARGQAVRVEGTVRVGAPEGFGTLFLAPRLGDLLARHPDLDVEVLTMPRFPSLAAREADLIVTLDPPQAGRYIATRLVDYTYGLFASSAYLRQHPPIRGPKDLLSHTLVGYLPDMVMSPQLHYLEELIGEHRLRLSTSGMLAQVTALRAGLGVGVLAHYLAGGTGLRPVLSRSARWHRTFWLATHADWFRLRRIQVVWSFIRELTESQADHFLPATGRGAPRREP